MGMTRRDSMQTMAAGLAAISLLRPEWSYPARSDKSVIRIAFNENPDGPSPAAREAIRSGAGVANRYIMDEQQELERTIAQREGIEPGEVILGSGSGEVLAMAGVAFGLEKEQIIAADNTFFILPQYAKAIGAQLVPVPLTETFHHDLDAMASKVNSNTSLVYICNPNNPTGTVLDAAKLRAFCEEVGRTATVLVDEAYLDYEPDLSGSMIDRVRKGKNVIVTRTFSKIYGMAGMRIGYGLAPKPIADRLKRVRMTWINHLSANAALASFGETDFVKHSRERNAAAREAFCAVLRKKSIRYVPSHTNFIYVYAGQQNRDLPAALLANGIMISRGGKPLTEDWARFSVGTMQEMQAAGAALEQVYQS
jgi:histidinol-phosphate aminotransferase